MVAEHREMNRRLAQPRQFKVGIERGAFAFVGCERRRVAGIEIGDHRLPRGKRFDAYETPRLAVADRGREGGEAQDFLYEHARHRVRLKAADVAPPCQKLCQAVAEDAVENGRIALLFSAPHRRLRRTAWSVITSGPAYQVANRKCSTSPSATM